MTAQPNLEIVRRYLAILQRNPNDPELDTLLDPSFVFREYPNRLNPGGRTLNLDALRPLTLKAAQITLEQAYTIRTVVGTGDELALEVDWVGRFNIPFASTPAGQPIRASLGMFMTFRDGRIVSQRNYDCYEPF
jgi:ketosteroid isomerase-like protein